MSQPKIPKIELTRGPNALSTEEQQFELRWYGGYGPPWGLLLVMAKTLNAIADRLNSEPQ